MSYMPNPIFIRHFLIECIDLALRKDKFFKTNGLKELFENIETNNIIS